MPPQPVDTTMAYVKLIEVVRCAEGCGTFVEHDGRELAVFRLTNPTRVVVTDNACPHANGNLSAGDVVGQVVSCPWHDWRFDLNTGVCVDSAHPRVARYPAESRDGFVYVDLDATGESDH